MRIHHAIGALITLACLAATSALAAPTPQAELKDARLWASPEKTRVVFDLSSDTQPDIFMLADPYRLVVDLPRTKNTGHTDRSQADTALIRRIRTGIRHGTDVRIVMDLTRAVRAKSFMLEPDADHGYRLVVDLYRGSGGEQAPGQRIAERAPEAEPDKPGVAARADSNQTDASPTREQADRTATALAESASGAPDAAVKQRDGDDRARAAAAAGRDIVVAVDAGHGGRDPGAHGPNGLQEKTVTLAIARRLKALIDEQPHMRAVLTRKTDRYVGLRERMVIARKDTADFFISIHCDASPAGAAATGASVYALSGHGATSEHARWLARRENAADLVGGTSLKDKNSSLASFVLDLSQSASIEASMDAASRVLTELDQLGDLHKHKVQQAGFMVLKSPDIPSILVETNFISNPAAEQKLATERYQTQLAEAMLLGIKGYFARYRPATFVTDAQTYRVKPGDTLSEIAARFGTTAKRLKQRNELAGTELRVGQTLTIQTATAQQLASRE